MDKNCDRGGANIKHELLVNRHVKCGCCDRRMPAVSSLHHGRSYRYYVCQFPRVEKQHRCLTYRAELVDAIVWEWIKRLLLDPEALRQGLEVYKQRQEENAGPISMHVSAINTVLIEKRAALQRLLDLYLAGEFHKDMLTDKKSELEKAIGELEHERSTLLASLRAQSLSEQQEQALMDFARKISIGLVCRFELSDWRAIIETLAVEVTLYLEEGVKKVQFKRNLGAGFSVLSPIVFKELAL